MIIPLGNCMSCLSATSNAWYVETDPKPSVPTDEALTLLMSAVMCQAPFLRQKVSDSTHEGQVLFWDYHVLAVERRTGGAQVYDPSRCPCMSAGLLL